MPILLLAWISQGRGPADRPPTVHPTFADDSLTLTLSLTLHFLSN
jgi:hypothetical protein